MFRGVFGWLYRVYTLGVYMYNGCTYLPQVDEVELPPHVAVTKANEVG